MLGTPAAVALTVKIDIDKAHLEEFQQRCADPIQSLFLVLELNSLEDPTNSEYDVVSSMPMENLSQEIQAEMSKLIPGRRSVRVSLLTGSKEVYEMKTVQFRVEDLPSVGSEVDRKR